jgi:adenosylcobinamide-GDP ribazoletransferase
MSGFRVAVSLLTRIPVGSGRHTEESLARAVPWFPVVGVLIGLSVAVVYALASFLWFGFVASVVAVGTGILLTGAFHEDGLADTVDAFGGGRDTEQTLRILKDPSLGTFGTIALIVSFLLRVGALSMLSVISALWVLPAAHALSRAIAIGALGWVSPVGGGLGADYGRNVTKTRAAVAIVVGLAVAGAALGWVAVPAVAFCGVAAWGWSRVALRRIGGLSGDVLGAIQQTNEVVILLAGAALSWGLVVGSPLGG